MPNHAAPLELPILSLALPLKVDKEAVTTRTVAHLDEAGREGEEEEVKEVNNLELLQWVHSLTLPLRLSRPVSCTLLLQSGTLPLSNTTLTNNLTSKNRSFILLTTHSTFLTISLSFWIPTFISLFASHCSVSIPFFLRPLSFSLSHHGPSLLSRLSLILHSLLSRFLILKRAFLYLSPLFRIS